jgi:hypothetical protein
MTGELLPEPPFVVYRAARGVPPGWMPPELEGRWEYRGRFTLPRLPEMPGTAQGRAVVIPTSRVEHREDGASAQVLEVHPVDGNYDDDPAMR